MRRCIILLLSVSSGLFAATLTVNPDFLSFTAPPGSTMVQTKTSILRNTGTAANGITCTDNRPWLSVSPSSGINLGTNQQITLTISFNPTGFQNGDNDNGTVTCTGGGSTVQIDVSFGINGAEITLSNSNVQVSGVVGERVTTQISVSRVGGGNTQISVNKQTGGTWLTVTQGSATTPSSITITTDAAGLTPQTLQGSLVVSCTGNLPCVPKAASITFTITPNTPVLSLSTSAFSFSTNIGATTPQQTVVNLRNDGLATNFTIASNATWLTVTPTSGSIGQNQTVQLTVRGNPTGLTAPTNPGTLTITSTAPTLTISVSFNIQGGSNLSVNQSALTLNTNVGSTIAQTAQVTVSNAGGSASYTAAPQVPATWLSISPSSGTIGASQTLNVTANAAGLAAGIYNATVNISLGVNVAASFTVRLTVNDFAAASSADGTAPLAPGTIASIFLASDVTNATLVNNDPQLPLEIGGVSVTVRGVRTGLFFISPREINFLVPEDATTGSATITIQNSQGTAASKSFQIVAVGPSLYTADATGTGPPAALVLFFDAGGNFQRFVLAANCNAAGQCSPQPISLSGPGSVFLQLYGTGIRNRTSLSNVSVNVGGSVLQVDYAGAQNIFPGLDQVNIRLPVSLAGRGTIAVTLIVDGIATKPVQVAFQ